MADFQVTDKTLLTSVDRTTDSLLIYDSSASSLKRTTTNYLLNLASQPLGTTDTQSPTNKTFDNTNIFTIRDDRLTLQDNSDTTKQAQFQLSGITTGTTRTLTLPNRTDTLVTLGGTETLTAKTLTSPTINTATISNPTLTVDTISEFTSANGVTIDGVLLKDSKINGSYITDSTVSHTQLALGVSVQSAYSAISAVATGTTTIPPDDTIPQITEGTEFITVSITPKSSTNILLVEALVFASNSSGAVNTVAALFQDSTANALTVSHAFHATATAPVQFALSYAGVSGTTSSTTFRVRIGGSGASTVTVNGQAGTRQYGTSNKTWLKVTEYKAV